MRQLAQIEFGQLTLVDDEGTTQFGHADTAGLQATLSVHHPRFYRAVAWGGGLGAAESYLRDEWDADDLTTVMRILASNFAALAGVEKGTARFLRTLRWAVHWLRRNTRAGAKRNISSHYDLSNDFFAVMLDPTMTYSSGVFPSRDASLEEASIEKYDRICRKLQLSPQDHVLEIGTGWGGFAQHAAERYGCRVTTTTISDQQHAYAANRFLKAGLDHQITLLKSDYRDLQGEFDKLVSIEMIEAVGEKYLPGYFAKCSELLKPNGMLALQAITIPDHRYDQYRKSVDFIQQYVFPGGFLPSIAAISNCVRHHTDLRFFHLEDFGEHYAETLKRWRENFWLHRERMAGFGFDNRFLRTWHYYLCYCEAGFRERQIGVCQLLLTKPACRRAAILSSEF